MKNSLSYLMYFKGNKKVVIRYIATLVITLIILMTAKIIIANLNDELSIYSEVDSKVICIYSSEDKLIDKNDIDKIKKIDNVDYVMPIKKVQVPFKAFVSSPDSVLYCMKNDDIKRLLYYLEINYDEEVVNDLKKDEVITSNRVKKNKSLTEGENIAKGTELKYKNNIETHLLVSFTPEEFQYGSEKYLVIPKRGKINEVRSEVQSLVRERYEIEGENMAVQEANKNSQDTFNIAKIIITISCAITTGVTTYLHYFNRKKEFGILKALGYSDKKIVRRITKEIIISTIIALGTSIIIVFLEVYAMNTFLAEPKGYMRFMFNISMLSDMLIMILSMMLFSIIPTWELLKSIDKITLIEGGY